MSDVQADLEMARFNSSAGLYFEGVIEDLMIFDTAVRRTL